MRKGVHMRIGRVVFVLIASTGLSPLVTRVAAQSPSGASAQTKGGAVPTVQIYATLAQLMKGIIYPSANVFFAAQSDNPADVPPAKDPAMATNPLASSYGKWEAVENG